MQTFFVISHNSGAFFSSVLLQKNFSEKVEKLVDTEGCGEIVITGMIILGDAEHGQN